MAFLYACRICQVEKSEEDFYKVTRRYKEKVYTYRNKKCKTCALVENREWRLKNDPKIKDQARKATLKTYGLTQQQYDEMYQAQDGKCAICHEPPGQWGVTQRALAVDHDHKTGKVRGLLCDGCNRALGIMRDDPARLMSAVAYLFEHEELYGVPLR